MKAPTIKATYTIGERGMDNLLELPCVWAIFKTARGKREVAVDAGHVRLTYAGIGDTIVEYSNGKWGVIRQGDGTADPTDTGDDTESGDIRWL